MPRITKKDIYKEFGIDFVKHGKSTWHIQSPAGSIPPVLVDGNEKIGKGVYHFSTLPGCKDYNVTLANGKTVFIPGTCAGNCENGYCMRGRYAMQNVQNSLANKTVLAREHLDFLERAIMAQIKANKIKTVRIHVTGDFFSVEYLEMWKRIIASNPGTVFWTYTKETAAEKAFDEFENANIVKSNTPVIDGIDSKTNGYNFGHCDYIIAMYKFLKAMGKNVYICRCGIDDNQHCTNCTACAKCDVVLFLEHGTDYDAKSDPLYPELVNLINSQDDGFITK